MISKQLRILVTALFAACGCAQKPEPPPTPKPMPPLDSTEQFKEAIKQIGAPDPPEKKR